MANYNITRYKYTGSLSCLFEHNDKYYKAVLSITCDNGGECMVYEADSKGKVTDWGGLLCDDGLDITEENLIKCIEAFKEGKYCLPYDDDDDDDGFLGMEELLASAENMCSMAREHCRKVLSMKLESGDNDGEFLTMACSIPDDRGAMGLSTLQMPTIDKVSETLGEGVIYVHWEHDPDDVWVDIDDIDLDMLLRIATIL